MSKPTTRPQLSVNDQVEFLDCQRPVLGDGDYELTVTHSVPTLGIEAARSLPFTVKGPRFRLAPSDIGAQFPPPGSSGDFENVLPHITLKRPTLPWERSPEEGASDAPPWMALLVFAADDLVGRVKTVTVADLVGDRPKSPKRRDKSKTLLSESTDDLTASVLVIDVPLGTRSKNPTPRTAFSKAEDLLPQLNELPLLTTVRTVNGADHQAVVIANRLPVPGVRNVAHLVSLEHQFGARGSHWTEGNSPSSIQLVSLAHWEFHCAPAHGDLAQVLSQVEIAPQTLQAEGISAVAQAIVATGAVPVSEHQQDGTIAPAWYRGPLSPIVQSRNISVPARRAEDLIVTDRATAMSDISYAAAWKLGQLLCLRNPAVTQPLQRWKRAMIHARHAALHHEAHPEHAEEFKPPEFPVQRWFTEALLRLGEVPFSYLLADPELLPPESLSFFQVDPAWTRALCDGAFSIGRTSERDREDDGHLLDYLDLGPALSGVILRSRAVRGWPDLLLDGFADRTNDHDLALKPVRMAKLGPETLIALYDQRVVQADLHLHPMALHFGVHRKGAGFSKPGVSTDLFRDPARRVLDISGIAADLNFAHSPPKFAFAMIEGLPRVRFLAGVPS